MLIPPTRTIESCQARNVTVTIETNFRQGEVEVKEEVVTLTATIERNLPQGDLETEVDGTEGDVTETETERNEALSEQRRVELLISDGAVVRLRKRQMMSLRMQRGWACDAGIRRSRAGPHRLRAVVGAVRPRRALCDSLSRHGTRCGVVFLLSRGLAQVHWKGDLGNEVDGMKGGAVELLNGEVGRPNRGALCGSHKTVVPNCVNVWFYCVTPLAVLFGGSSVGVKTDALVVSLLLVPCCVCVVGFSVVNRQFDDVAFDGFRGAPEEHGRGIRERWRGRLSSR